MAPASRAVFLAFLGKVFAGTGKEMCEAALVRGDRTWFWANFHGTSAISDGGPRKWCRVVISDITALKASEEAQRRLEVLGVANLELRREIAQRQTVEESLRRSEQEQGVLLERSEYMQEQLRHLSRQVLQAQEEERKRISRELHDVIAQTLTGINNIRLANLKKEAGISSGDFGRSLTRTQELVEKSVNLVHRFARELRPAVLDDLGPDSRPAFVHEKLYRGDRRAHAPDGLLRRWSNWTRRGARCSSGWPRRRAEQCGLPRACQPGGSKHPEIG